MRDHLRGGTHFLADIGMSSTAAPGHVFATRLFPLEEQGFVMTGGAGLPVTRPAGRDHAGTRAEVWRKDRFYPAHA